MNTAFLKIFFKKLILTLLFLLIVTWKLASQVPKNNPCSNAEGHWSNAINWSKVYNADNFKGLIQKANKVDSTSLHERMKQIAKKGGGILFFPAGTYYFDFDLSMVSDVVIRGEISEEGVENKLLTKFVFPQYMPSFQGMGTPNNTAFKKILAGTVQLKNFGIVNVDVNRAVIDFKIPQDQPYHDNVIVYGIRQNNAAQLDPRFPSKIQIDEAHGWQRWPLWNGDNIGLSFQNNAIISDCIINDSTTEDFAMPNYMTDDGYMFDFEPLRFRYDLHTGIVIFEANTIGNKNIEIKNNKLRVAESALELYFHPGIALYVANLENEKDKEILYKYIKVPKSKAAEYVLGSYIHLENNVVENVDDEKENFLVDRKFHYSIPYQNEVRDHFKKQIYINKENDTLIYYIKTPTDMGASKQFPLVVFFHGTGEIGGNNPLVHFVNMFSKENINEEYPSYVIVPQLGKAESWISHVDAPPTKPIQLTYELINEVIEKYQVDRNKISLAGVSYGSGAVFEMLTKRKNIFSTAVVTSYLFTPKSITQLRKLRKTEFQITTGLKDTNLPVQYARMMVESFKSAGISVRYNEYNVGHFSWIPLTSDSEFISWLFKDRKLAAE